MTGRPWSPSNNRTGLASRYVILLAVALSIFLLSSGLSQDVSNAQGANKKALFLLPVESYTGIEFSYLQSYLHDNAYYDIVVKRDREVDLETIKHLSDYDVVFINSHGSVANNKFEFATGVIDNPQAVMGNYSDLKNGLLTHAIFSSGSDWRHRYIPVFRVGVTSSYLAKYNNFHDTLIYAYCCFSQTDSVLARSVMDKGARGVIGFQRAAVFAQGDNSGDYADARETKTFFQTATDPGVSVDKAYNDVYRDTHGIDPNSHQDTGPPCYGWVLKANKGESLYLGGKTKKLPEVPDVGEREAVEKAVMSYYENNPPGGQGPQEVEYKVMGVDIRDQWAQVVIHAPAQGEITTPKDFYSEDLYFLLKKEGGMWTVIDNDYSGCGYADGHQDAPEDFQR